VVGPSRYRDLALPKAHTNATCATPRIPTLALCRSLSLSRPLASARDLYFDRRPINGRRARVLHASAVSIRPIGTCAASHFGPYGCCAHVHRFLLLPSPLRRAAYRGGCSHANVCARVCINVCASQARQRALVHRGRVFPLENGRCCISHSRTTSVLLTFRTVFKKPRWAINRC